MAKVKVKLKGFPEISFTAKVILGRQQHMFVKLGSGDLGSEDFLIEVETPDTIWTDEPTEEHVLAAALKWEQMVWEALVERLHEHVKQIQAEFSARSVL